MKYTVAIGCPIGFSITFCKSPPIWEARTMLTTAKTRSRRIGIGYRYIKKLLLTPSCHRTQYCCTHYRERNSSWSISNFFADMDTGVKAPYGGVSRPYRRTVKLIPTNYPSWGQEAQDECIPVRPSGYCQLIKQFIRLNSPKCTILEVAESEWCRIHEFTGCGDWKSNNNGQKETANISYFPVEFLWNMDSRKA